MRVTIIGGGISGLSLAYYLNKTYHHDITILEAEESVGGKIRTDSLKGYLCERAVNGFLDNRPQTLSFIKELGIEPLRSNDNARKRYIYSEGKLHLIPESPLAFLLSDLISLPGKGRLFLEIIMPKGRVDDESISSFVRRRLGREAYEKLIDPMVSGIYAGDPEALSIRSAFPRIFQLERQYGSLIKALLILQRKAKKSGATIGPSPSGTLTSFREGMESVIKRLRSLFGESIRSKSKAVAVEPAKKGFLVHLQNGETIETELAVLAVPAYEASSILKELDKEVSKELSTIPYPPVSVVCLGYREEDIPHALNGFGFLVPYKERRKILGTLWDSSIFPGRAPEGCVLLRTMVGGAREPELAMLDDEKLLSTVLGELKDIMDIDEEPEFVAIYRHEKAIPQYLIGHEDKVKAVEERISNYKGLYITGNALRGIGFNDCIERSFKLSQRIASKLNN